MVCKATNRGYKATKRSYQFYLREIYWIGFQKITRGASVGGPRLRKMLRPAEYLRRFTKDQNRIRSQGTHPSAWPDQSIRPKKGPILPLYSEQYGQAEKKKKHHEAKRYQQVRNVFLLPVQTHRAHLNMLLFAYWTNISSICTLSLALP